MMKLRTEAQLYAAAERAGIANTEKFAKDFYELAERAGEAAAALAKAQVAAQNRFDRRTAFLSQEDITIASKLKDIYPDVAEALNSAEAAQMRFNSSARQLSTSIENNLTSGLTDFVSGTKSASEAFSDMAKSILRDIEQIAIKTLIVQPLMKSIGLAVLPSAHGNVFSGGSIVPFAQGGVVDSPTIAPMALFGEAGPEAIMPLRRGPDGNLGVSSAGGGGRVENHNYYINAPGSDQGTIQQLKVVVGQLGKAVKIQGDANRSARRFEATGVG
ncbi:phage-related minor tail protein [Bradyrhizobium yuanmingense]|uniref:phage tail tape measure protein n=1 Tax=Bradyrhizobium yuanmingense TaxID=108015 RepID=UPI00351679FB